MKTFLKILIILVLFLTLGACQHLAPTPAMQPILGTPEAAQTTSITEASISGLELDSATQKVLQTYPLWEGTTWVYAYLGYDQDTEVVWRVVEKVVSTDIVHGYYIAELERTAERIDGDPSHGFPSSPETGTFWYLIDGENLYLYDNPPDLEFSQAWLDLVIPFPPEGEAWYPHPDLRSQLNLGEDGYRHVSNPFKQVLPMGGTFTCYNVATRFTEGVTEGIFCETVGFVFREFIYFEEARGYRSEMIEFSGN